MALSRISQAEFRDALQNLLKEECAFEGRFEYRESAELASERVLDVKNSEKEERRQKLLNRIRKSYHYKICSFCF